MSLSKNFPTVRPTLLLDFANTQALDPRITFTRASPAVYYNGDTYALAEQNLLLQSQTFTVSPWVSLQMAASVVNAGTAPDGTNTATKIIANNTNNYHNIYQIINTVSSTYTFSVFAKSAEYTKLCLADPNTFRFIVTFDLATGNVLSTAGPIFVSASASRDAATGWVRCSVTINVISANVYFSMVGYPDAGTTIGAFGALYTGDNTSGILVWGSQVEQRGSLTAYTATTTETITNYVPQLLTAPAGTARFDFNPVTQASLGMLIEETRTNLITDSETLGSLNAATGFSNIGIAPNGTQTADLLVANTANSEHYSDKSASVNNTVTYSYTVYAKTYAGARLCMRIATTGTAYAFYNLETGVITSGLGTQFVSADMTAVGNGWWRCRLTFTASSTGTAVIRCHTAGPTDTFVYAGNNWAGIYLWGWQVEVGTFATSYIATSGGTATRNADVPVMTGTNFSSWYDNSQGTLFAQASSFTNTSASGNPVAVASLGTATNNRIQVRFVSNMAAFAPRLVANGASILAGGPSTTTSNVQYKQAVSYQSGNTVAYGSGALIESNTSPFVLFNVTSMDIGFGNTSDSLNGHIQKIAYYAERLTATQLQALTQS